MDIVKSGINVESPLNAESGGQEELLEVAEGQQVGLGGFGAEDGFSPSPLLVCYVWKNGVKGEK